MGSVLLSKLITTTQNSWNSNVANITVRSCCFKFCVSMENGGAFAYDSDKTLNINFEKSTFYGCSSNKEGGAFYISCKGYFFSRQICIFETSSPLHQSFCVSSENSSFNLLDIDLGYYTSTNDLTNNIKIVSRGSIKNVNITNGASTSDTVVSEMEIKYFSIYNCESEKGILFQFGVQNPKVSYSNFIEVSVYSIIKSSISNSQSTLFNCFFSSSKIAKAECVTFDTCSMDVKIDSAENTINENPSSIPQNKIAEMGCNLDVDYATCTEINKKRVEKQIKDSADLLCYNIVSSVFEGISSEESGSAIFFGLGYSKLMLVSTTFDKCMTKKDLTNGGAIYIRAETRFIMSSCCIRDCEANGKGIFAYIGGGIHTYLDFTQNYFTKTASIENKERLKNSESILFMDTIKQFFYARNNITGNYANKNTLIYASSSFAIISHNVFLNCYSTDQQMMNVKVMEGESSNVVSECNFIEIKSESESMDLIVENLIVEKCSFLRGSKVNLVGVNITRDIVADFDGLGEKGTKIQDVSLNVVICGLPSDFPNMNTGVMACVVFLTVISIIIIFIYLAKRLSKRRIEVNDYTEQLNLDSMENINDQMIDN